MTANVVDTEKRANEHNLNVDIDEQQDKFTNLVNSDAASRADLDEQRNMNDVSGNEENIQHANASKQTPIDQSEMDAIEREVQDMQSTVYNSGKNKQNLFIIICCYHYYQNYDIISFFQNIR